MPLLDEVSEPIDLSKRIDFPAGFSVTPAAPDFSVAEVHLLLCVGLSLLALLILGILKRKTVMFFLEDAGLNLAAVGLNVFRAARSRSRSIGREIERRASDKS